MYKELISKYSEKYQKIFPGVNILGPLEILCHPSKVNIAPGVNLGHPSIDTSKDFFSFNFENDSQIRSKVRISENVTIGPYSIIHDGVTLEKRVFLESRITIRQDSNIKENSHLWFGCYIGKKVQVGKRCKIGGFICNDSIIGNDSAILGSLVHKYPHPCIKKREKAPVIGNNVLVSMNSTVIGNVTVENNVRIAAGAIVMKDVPKNALITGIWK